MRQLLSSSILSRATANAEIKSSLHLGLRQQASEGGGYHHQENGEDIIENIEAGRASQFQQVDQQCTAGARGRYNSSSSSGNRGRDALVSQVARQLDTRPTSLGEYHVSYIPGGQQQGALTTGVPRTINRRATTARNSQTSSQTCKGAFLLGHGQLQEQGPQ